MLRLQFRLLLCVTILALLLPGVTQAKRFKRYPDDIKKEKEAKAKSQPSRRPAKATPDPIQDLEHGIEFAPETGGSEPEEAPGLLGHALHGRDGLTVEYIYTGEVFSNARGGMRTRKATEYLGLIDIAVSADLDKMGFSPGGTFFMLMEDSHGHGISQYVGDYQGVSNIDGGRPFAQVTEYWWERTICDDFIRTRLGKQDANAEFAVVELGGDFCNGSYGLHYNIPMPAWPDAAMGAVTFFDITEDWSFKFGIFDGAADGRTWGVSGTGELFTIYEIKGYWSLLNDRLPGDFHFGMWHHSGDFADMSGHNITRRGSQGGYVGFDQMIFRESWDEDNDQGLGIFGQYAWAPDDRNEAPAYVGGGLVYKGLIHGRDDDMLGAGITAVFGSNRLLLPEDSESTIELYYKVQLSPYVMIQPDLQYITHPSAQFRDSFVAGVRFEVVL